MKFKYNVFLNWGIHFSKTSTVTIVILVSQLQQSAIKKIFVLLKKKMAVDKQNIQSYKSELQFS